MIEKQFVKIVRTMRAEIDDARWVSVYVLDNGGLQIEWERPDDDPRSLARYTTKVGLSPESFAVTTQVMRAMIGALADDIGEDVDETFTADHATDEAWQDRKDAERYRKWRDSACYRPAEIAKALASCITPSQIDRVLDLLT